jgi:hypothetical protein
MSRLDFRQVTEHVIERPAHDETAGSPAHEAMVR